MKTGIKLIIARSVASILLLSMAVLVGTGWPGVGARAQVSVPGQPLVPLGYCQLTSIDTAAALTSCADGIPSGATYAIITAEAQAIRWRDDTTNPSATVGMPVAVGAPFFYAGTLSRFRVISQTSGAKLNVAFYRG